MTDETLFEKEIEEDIIEDDIEDYSDDEEIEDIDNEDNNEDSEEEEEDDLLDDDILDDLDDLLEDYDEEKEEKKEEIVEKRTTFNILTKYEKNFLIGFRTQQLINGSVALIDVTKLKEKTPYAIAQEELRQRRIPFKVKRTLPNGKI